MKLKIEFSKKDKHIINNIFAIFICICNWGFMLCTAIYLEKIVPNWSKVAIEISSSAIWTISTYAIIKYYNKKIITFYNEL